MLLLLPSISCSSSTYYISLAFHRWQRNNLPSRPETGNNIPVYDFSISGLAAVLVKEKWVMHECFNTSNAEASFVRRMRMWLFLWKPSKPYHVGIHWIALAEYSQMSTRVPGFQSFSWFLRHFVLAKLDSSSISVKDTNLMKTILDVYTEYTDRV